MRGVLIDWLVEVHTQFKLLQETLYMTVYIIDKYLQVCFLSFFDCNAGSNRMFSPKV